MNLRSRKGRATLADRYPIYVRISQKSPENNDASQEPPELEEAVSSRINPLQLSSPHAPVFAIRFPVEIWTMILSYFPPNHPFSSTETALCSLAMNMANYRAPPCEGRCIMLRSLSLTCKALRAVMLPLLWEEVDICARHASSAHVPFRECMAYVLREHSLGLLRTPTVAIYVRTFTVFLPRHSGTRFLQPFAKCLAALPNLRRLRILGSLLTLRTLESVFRRRRYPQVRELILPADAYTMLQAFPQITELVVNRFSSVLIFTLTSALNHSKNLHNAIITHCPRLKLLSTDLLSTHHQHVHGILSLCHIQKLATALPDLETMIVSLYPATPQKIQEDIAAAQVVQQIVYLSELPNLAHIKINLAIPPLYTDMDIWTFKSQMLTCLDNAWKVLETRKHKKSKSLVIRTWPGSRYPVFNHYLNDIITLVSSDTDDSFVWNVVDI